MFYRIESDQSCVIWWPLSDSNPFTLLDCLIRILRVFRNLIGKMADPHLEYMYYFGDAMKDEHGNKTAEWYTKDRDKLL